VAGLLTLLSFLIGFAASMLLLNNAWGALGVVIVPFLHFLPLHRQVQLESDLRKARFVLCRRRTGLHCLGMELNDGRWVGVRIARSQSVERLVHRLHLLAADRLYTVQLPAERFVDMFTLWGFLGVVMLLLFAGGVNGAVNLLFNDGRGRGGQLIDPIPVGAMLLVSVVVIPICVRKLYPVLSKRGPYGIHRVLASAPASHGMNAAEIPQAPTPAIPKTVPPLQPPPVAHASSGLAATGRAWMIASGVSAFLALIAFAVDRFVFDRMTRGSFIPLCVLLLLLAAILAITGRVKYPR
jgi:hypothetical protein